MAEEPLDERDADDGVRLSEGERLAEPYFREVAAATRHLARGDGRGERLIGYQLGRHLAFNRLRLARVFQGLEPHERRVLAVLPWLLDQHQPGLPGYHPDARHLAGVYNFEGNTTLRDAVADLFGQGLDRRALTRHAPPIRSVWIETETGTLVERDPPAITLYAVIDLPADGAAGLLDARFADLAHFAGKHGVDLTCTALDPARVQAGELGGVRQAPARSAAALERFYRTAVYLAGQLPLWWCVPHGADAAAHARAQAALDRAPRDVALAFFDLGPVPLPPQRLRLRAALARLDEGHSGPLGFCLDLAALVLDLDARRPPACERLKQAIHGRGDGDPIVDPVLQRFDDVVTALRAAGEHADAATIEALAWLKIGLYLARTTTHRETFIERFRGLAGPCVTRWGWRAEHVALLDGLVGWPEARVTALDRDVRALLLRLYQRLAALARATPDLVDDDVIAALGRRLIALIGAEAGRVRLHFGYLIEESRAEDHLVLLEQPDAARRSRWAVHRHVIRRAEEAGEEPMWSGESLAAVAAWAVVNGVFAPGTAVRALGEARFGTAADLRDVFDAIDDLTGRPDPLRRPPAAYREPRRIRRAALLAAFDEATNDPQENSAVRVLPENWDILNYGRARQSRLRDVSVITLDTWDTVACHRFRGQGALMSALRAIYAGFDVDHPLERPPDVLVPQGAAARATKNRLRQIMRGADRISLGTRVGARRAFLYEVAGRFQVLRRDERGVCICGVQSLRGALRLLGAVGEDDQQITADRLSPTLGELRALAERRKSDPTAEVCVGWRQVDGGGLILICDELGRLYGRHVGLKQLEPLLLRLVRRIIHRLRTRVRDTRTLRRVLRVFEMREGGSLGADVQLREDTVRVISLLSEPRQRHPELFLRGHLTAGRDGVFIEYDGQRYDPRERGRRFALDLLEAMIAHRDRYPRFDLFIEASSVRFGDAPAAGRERGIVKHLRLIDLYERHLARALRAMRDGGPAVMTARRPFSRKAVE
ncbi:MAG: class I adenylate cyclase [bacterium]